MLFRSLVIDALADDFGVSVVPVREAIRRLEAEGLIVYRPNVGAQVAPADPGLFEEEMTVLAVLEGYATALAAADMGPEDVERLEEINNEMVECMNTFDSLGFGSHNQAFHMAIYERCPNPYLVELLRQTCRRLDAIRRTVFTQIPYRGWESIREHRDLIALIDSHASFSQIEAVAREHKLHTVEAFRHQRRQHELATASATTQSR